jgi:hypothetical protein
VVSVSRIFLLSPANCRGTRGKQASSPRATFAVAEQLRSPDGVAIGDLFAFVSGLYFRGKLTYARRFAAPPEPGHPIVGAGIHVITPNAGLRPPETRVTREAFHKFSGAEVHPDNAAYRRPLEQSARALAGELCGACDVVLLGSIASPKYVDVLLAIFGDRLVFPVDFVGRGDMSRAACSSAGRPMASSSNTDLSRGRCATVRGRRSCRRFVSGNGGEIAAAHPL